MTDDPGAPDATPADPDRRPAAAPADPAAAPSGPPAGPAGPPGRPDRTAGSGAHRPGPGDRAVPTIPTGAPADPPKDTPTAPPSDPSVAPPTGEATGEAAGKAADPLAAEPADPLAAAPAGPAGAPAPALVAGGLGLMGESDWVFRDVDLTVAPGTLAAIVGPAGSGRSSLLLTLAGRMRPTAGTLSVLGHDLAADPAGVRDLTSVARVAAVIGPEPALTVRESVDERCLIDDVDPAEGRRRFDRACALLQFTPDPSALAEGLVGERGTLLAVALASVRTGAVIVLDDLDRDIPPAGRRALAQALARLAASGPAIVVTAADRDAVPGADPIVELQPPAGRPAWTFDPAVSTEA